MGLRAVGVGKGRIARELDQVIDPKYGPSINYTFDTVIINHKVYVLFRFFQNVFHARDFVDPAFHASRSAAI